jgi:hypothetical protein
MTRSDMTIMRTRGELGASGATGVTPEATPGGGGGAGWAKAGTNTTASAAAAPVTKSFLMTLSLLQ